MAALVPLPQTPLPLDVLCMVPDRPDLLQAEGGVEKNEDCQHHDWDTYQDMCHHGLFLLVTHVDISTICTLNQITLHLIIKMFQNALVLH